MQSACQSCSPFRAVLQEQNLGNCKANLETAKNDVDLIKDFKTTTEVNIARVYNHDLLLKRKGKV